MNPEHPDTPDARLDPEHETAVRAALADAGAVGPMPPEVTARLDAVVADLATSADVHHEVSVGSLPADHPEAAVVRPLDPAARRRRTQVRVLLGAAAAMVVVGVSAGVISGQGGGDLSTADSLASTSPGRQDAAGGSSLTEQDSSGDLASALEDTSPAAPAEVSTPGREMAPQSLVRVETPEPAHTVRASHLRQDLVALQHVIVSSNGTDYTGSSLLAPASFMCPPAAYGAGVLVGVVYEGRSAVVSFHEPVGTTQETEVLACGTGDVLHSTTLPVS